MITIISLTIINLIALCFAYLSGKKNKENEILRNSVVKNKNNKRIGDLEEIKNRLNNNEF